MNRVSALLGTILAIASCASLPAADDLIYSVIPPPTSVPIGAKAEVQVAVLNASTRAVTASLPKSIPGSLTRAQGKLQVALQMTGNPPTNDTIAPGEFRLYTYTLDLPFDAPSGTAMLEVELDGVGPRRAALDLVPQGAAGRRTTPVEGPTTNLGRAEPGAGVMRGLFAERLGLHAPIYFIYGDEEQAAKFQFSIKYKLLDFRGLGHQRLARSLQFAFTQRSVWDIESESSPFFDTSYMPEIMYEALAPVPEAYEGQFTWLGFQAGYKHESNGRAGAVSRSLNTVYARTVFALGDLNSWHLLAMPEVFTYVGDRNDNPDLDDYRGYGKLTLVFGRNDNASLMASIWTGREFDRASYELNLTVPVRTRLLRFETYLLVQYFNGFGESLLMYDRKSESLRAGIALVR